MEFIDAEKKLKGIVGNIYHSLSYEKTFHRDGTITTKCSIYVPIPQGFYSGHDWKEAFANLRKGYDAKTY